MNHVEVNQRDEEVDKHLLKEYSLLNILPINQIE